MKIPRNFSLGLAGLLFTAWMTWAVKPRYQVYQVWSNVEHETSWEFYIIKNEVPHVPFVRSIERSYFTIGGPTRRFLKEVSGEIPYTKFMSSYDHKCQSIEQSGVTWFGYELRSMRTQKRGESPEATSACVAADALIQEYAAKLEKQ